MAELDIVEDLTPDEQAAMDADRQAEYTETPEAPPQREETLPEPESPSEDSPPPAAQVPYAAMREERDKRQALEGQLAATRQNIERLEGMFEKLATNAGAPQVNEPEAPSWEEDPDGYTAHMLDRMDRRLQEMEWQNQQTTQQQRQMTEEQRFIEAYQTSAQQYARQKPDFQNAYQHVVDTLDQELQHRGFINPQERDQILKAEERAMVQRAMAAGRNPAELIYEYAQFRGYKDSPQKAERKIDTIQQGQQHQPMPQGGGDTEIPISLERLAEADGDEFDKLWQDAQKKGMLG